MRSSGGNKQFGRWGSLKERRNISTSSNNSYSSPMFQNQQYGRMSMADPDSNSDSPHEFHRAALYILGDKTQMKVIKLISLSKCICNIYCQFSQNNIYILRV